MEKPFPVYRGADPYIFVCYAHANAHVVYKELAALRERGFNIWYDDGISAGSVWRGEIAGALTRADAVLFFISSASLASDHCSQEIHFALDKGVEIVPVYLERVDLPPDLELGVARIQAIEWEDTPAFIDQLTIALHRPDMLPARTAPAPKDRGCRLAVLPFASPGIDPEYDYLGDACAEEILIGMANAPGVAVTARASSFRYRGERDLEEAGKALGVDLLLDGTVRVIGSRVRIALDLVDTAAGTQLWGKSFQPDESDLFDALPEMAQAVLAAIQSLPGYGVDVRTTAARPSGGRAPDARAYRTWLKARHLFRQGKPEPLQQARALLGELVRTAPGYALAWDLSGLVLFRLADLGLTAAQDAYREGIDALHRAMDLDPSDARIHAHLAWYAMQHEFDLDKAERHLAKAYELEPASDTVRGHAGKLALALGRVDEAVGHRRHVAERNPLDRTSQHNLGNALFYAGLYARAYDAYSRALEISPGYPGGHFYRGLTLLLRKELDLASVEFEAESDAGWRLQGQSLLARARGEEQEASRLLGLLIDGHADDMAVQIASTCAWLARTDEAFHWLSRALESRDPGMTEVLVDPLFEPLRGDPRWRSFLADHG